MYIFLGETSCTVYIYIYIPRVEDDVHVPFIVICPSRSISSSPLSLYYSLHGDNYGKIAWNRITYVSSLDIAVAMWLILRRMMIRNRYTSSIYTRIDLLDEMVCFLIFNLYVAMIQFFYFNWIPVISVFSYFFVLIGFSIFIIGKIERRCCWNDGGSFSSE